MHLLILLAILNFYNDYVSSRELRYTNTWAAQINGDVKEAMTIAEMYGFTYKMKVCFR